MKWSTTSVGYEEAEPSAQDQDNYLNCKDLAKVAVFCKEALNVQLIEGILGIETVCRAIKIYLLVLLLASGLFGLIELTDDARIPDSLESMPSLIDGVPEVVKVASRAILQSNTPANKDSTFCFNDGCKAGYYSSCITYPSPKLPKHLQKLKMVIIIFIHDNRDNN